eukprot:TRINITY_DN6973_c0_g1_i5.p1 TRINITY_DN6973_c0_g1~~TRINITY_DN6973_c0_g1_i5.p1  ORF type:complete len:396 (-),score=106.64 TRINITY_DN6973_c0_g1_i5:60-1247(-)
MGWIEEIKFSPDSTKVAFGAHKGASPVQVLNVTDKKLSENCVINVGMTSALLHLDWSKDSQFMVANSQAYELKFINLNTRKDNAASASRDIEWETWTCKLGFPVQGVFKTIDYTDVNTVARANNQKVLATGDDDGLVNLYKYPCVVERAKCKAYVGHSSHVTRVRFSADDSFLISVGGNDKSVLVWETDFGTGSQEAEEEKKEGEDEEIDEEFVQRKKVKKKNVTDVKGNISTKKVDEDSLFEVEDTKHGDEFMAVKPWLGAIKQPSDFKTSPPNQEKAPAVYVELEYVHGYRTKDCRNNLRYLRNGNIVYNAAALGIVMDVHTNTQRFFDKHADDVTAIDLHPDGEHVATGELGPKPTIYVWSTQTMQVKFSLKGGIIKGIAALAFSVLSLIHI